MQCSSWRVKSIKGWCDFTYREWNVEDNCNYCIQQNRLAGSCAIQCSHTCTTVQCCAITCKAIQDNALLCNTLKSLAIQCKASQGTVQGSAKPCNTLQDSAKQRWQCTRQCSIQCKAEMGAEQELCQKYFEATSHHQKLGHPPLQHLCYTQRRRDNFPGTQFYLEKFLFSKKGLGQGTPKQLVELK